MTTYQAPGVYVNERTPAPGPIQGVGTSVAAFVGATTSGPDVGRVEAVTNFTQFKQLFKDAPESDVGFLWLANAVYGFFNNGGTRCYVTRVASTAPLPKPNLVQSMGEAMSSAIEDSDLLSSEDAATLITAIQAQAQQAFNAFPLWDAVSTGQMQGTVQETLSTSITTVVNAESPTPESLSNLTDDQKSTLIDTLTAAARSAFDDWKEFDEERPLNLSEISIDDALTLLEPFDDISIVAAPGLTDSSQWDSLLSHCEPSGSYIPNRFAILDSPQGADWATNPPPASGLPQKSDYTSLYFPWIQVSDAITKQKSFVPPSGHIAGIYARVDTQRGVFKAPANESVFGALSLAAHVSSRQQEVLNANDSVDNPRAINCIRRLNGGILVWGARTVQATDSDAFKYISTRRTFNYIRASLVQGTQWAVFEPNNPALWGKIIRNVNSFLTKLWQSGGLFGSTPEEAFYVKCDEETNPPDVRAAGQVVTEVGVAITQPAEFVVFNLGLMSQAPGEGS